MSFRQPVARCRVRFRLLAAQDDLKVCQLQYWKRTEIQNMQMIDMQRRYKNGIVDEWITTLTFPEEAHYIRYRFLLTDWSGKQQYFNESGFSPSPSPEGNFELLQVNETDIRSIPEWSRGCVFYQIFPERFAIGNNPLTKQTLEPWSAKPTRENYLGGNLDGIRKKIPYLNDLGVDCLYLTPIFHADFNHKYATIDYFRIDPDFGSMEDFVHLVNEAHQAGIRVVLDGVFNHTGIKFMPFSDLLEHGENSKYKNWFYPKQFPLAINPESYECVGDYPYMPRLRVVNPEVREYVLSVLLFWLREAKIDGWRFDVADELDPSVVRFWRDHVKAIYPDALFLAETWVDARRLLNEGDQFDSAMNYLFRDVVISYFARGELKETQLDNRLQTILMKYSDETALSLYNCIGSHDTTRFLNEAGGDVSKLKMAFAFQILFPGAPAIYYGDELAMTGENDPGCRAGMTWETGDYSLSGYVQYLINLRKKHKAILFGSYKTIFANDQQKLFAFERIYQEECVIAVFNSSNMRQTLKLASWGETVDISPRSVEIIIK